MNAHQRAVEILADPHAGADDLVWAIVQVLRNLPTFDVDGVVVNAPAILRRLEDVADVIAGQRARIEQLADARPMRTTSRFNAVGRWNYG